MEELGSYRELAPVARFLGTLVFVGVLCLTALLERLQFLLRAAESSRWWASNGRDVLNAVAFGLMMLGLGGIGFSGPIALATAATLVITISVLQTSLAKYPRLALAFSIGVSLVVGMPVILAPRTVHSFFLGTVELLFGGAGFLR